MIGLYEVVRSRVISEGPLKFAINYEINTPSPTAKEIMSYVTRAVRKSRSPTPFKIVLSLGLILEAINQITGFPEIRYFVPNINTRVGPKVPFLVKTETDLNVLERHLEEDDYMERLINLREETQSRWKFIGVGTLTVEIFKLLSTSK